MTVASFLPWRREAHIGNLIDVLVQAERENPERLFAKDPTISLTYAEALAAVRGFRALYGEVVERRDVALSMANGVNFLITYLGVLYSGGVPALLNAGLPPKTGEALIGELSPAAVFTDAPLSFCADAVTVDAARLNAWRAADDGAASACGRGDDTATYFYSGGTTGVPKRVRYTHRKVMAAGERMQWGWPVGDGEVFLPIAPFSHIYGYLMGVCVALQCAGSSIMLERFRPSDALDAIEREGVTVLGGGPPAIYQALMSDPALASRNLSALRLCPGGGAPFPLHVHETWKALTGLTIFEGYGMTEMAPITVNTIEAGHRAGAAGKPVPDVEVSIVDLETGKREMPVGEAGEIRARGPHLMGGYCNNPDETALALRDGWLHTGDVGVVDGEGFLTITDRKKNVILHKGFNVFPREVEEAILTHPDISGACVVGAPDARSGEAVVAFVAPRGDAPLDVDGLLTHCRDYLLAYRMPTRIECLEELPLTPAGKLDRIALRQRACRGASEDSV